MSVHTPQKASVGIVRAIGPKPRFQTDDEQEWLALSAPDRTSAPESRRATPEEIDQVFTEQLAARPQSIFLREVVADRARRRRGKIDFGC
jgi:hypothetical protein